MIQYENESKFFEVSDKLVREDLLKTSKLDKARNPKIEKIASIPTEEHQYQGDQLQRLLIPVNLRNSISENLQKD